MLLVQRWKTIWYFIKLDILPLIYIRLRTCLNHHGKLKIERWNIIASIFLRVKHLETFRRKSWLKQEYLHWPLWVNIVLKPLGNPQTHKIKVTDVATRREWGNLWFLNHDYVARNPKKIILFLYQRSSKQMIDCTVIILK